MHMAENKHIRRLKRALMILFFACLCLVFIMPFYFMVISSFKPGTDVIRNGLSFGIDWSTATVKSYVSLFTYRDGIYFSWFKNSILIAAVQTITSLFFSAFVGYGLAMYEFKGKNLIFTLVLVYMMLPFEVLMLPLYRMLAAAHLLNTIFAVIMPTLVMMFAVFFFKQYCSSLPKELIDAGRIDGCTDYGIYFKIMLPLMRPAIGAMAILIAMRSWNNLLWPMLVISTDTSFTLPIGLATTMTPYGDAYDVIMPGAIFSVVPIMIAFFCCQNLFISGMTIGSVKE